MWSPEATFQSNLPVISVTSSCIISKLVWLIGLNLQTEGSLVQFPVRAHAWVVGQVPSAGHRKGNHTLMCLSLSFSLPSPTK